jgi:hypothetical protein
MPTAVLPFRPGHDNQRRLRFLLQMRTEDRPRILALSKRELRLVIRYDYNGIAIEAFKRSHARVQAGRIDADKHWGAAVWARMNFNFVGREAK